MAYYDLGTYSSPITTTSKKAQKWFDRGLNWTFGYNHEEAVRCFEKAAKHDPECAMAYWGIAYAAGPNYNMPWDKFDEASRARALTRCHEATKAAIARIGHMSPPEAALINALPARYPQGDLSDTMPDWIDNFASSMREAHLAHPDSLEIRSVFAESLLQRFPWQMWELGRARPTEGADTLECQKVLEEALEGDPRAMTHPGILHLYVHLMEMSPTPEKALKAGDALRGLVPDAGHLIHMATHIDVLCGQYRDVVHWNTQASRVDQKFYDREGPYNIYSGYRLHNFHFAAYGAMFLGQYEPAMQALAGIRATTPDDLLLIESPPMADFREAYLGFEPHVMVRFGKWQELLKVELPRDQTLFCSLTANILYAQGVALAALGHPVEARAKQVEFLAAKERVPESRLVHNNTMRDLLEVATQMLEGEIAYREGKFDAAFAALRKSVELEDSLPYDEPWGWMQPTRHALGALLFEQGRLDEAEAVFREDLGLGGQLSRATIHPDNIWALKGLYDCLRARDERVEIVQIKQRLDLANSRADQAAAAPCFCAQAAMTAS